MPPKLSDLDHLSDPKRHFLHPIVSQGEEHLPTLWVGVGVPPKPSDPDLISDPKRYFLHFFVSQGEGYLPTLWVGVCGRSLQILTLLQTRKSIFLHSILGPEENVRTINVPE